MGIDIYTKILQKFLQSKVVFKVNNKSLKSGTIKLFNIKQYFIRFYLEQENKEVKVLELPYPYNMHYDGINCSLNYNLTSLCNNHRDTVMSLRTFRHDGVHKFYDNNINIVVLK